MILLFRAKHFTEKCIKALRPKGRGFPAWCFLYTVPLDPALKGGDCGVLSGQEVRLLAEDLRRLWEQRSPGFPWEIGTDSLKMN